MVGKATGSGDGTVATDDLRIGYVGGGSGSWAPKLMKDLALCESLSGEVVLFDLDQERSERNARLGRMIDQHEAAVGDWDYTAVDDLGTALEGADFVIISTQDPPGETMVTDLELPREYGIFQSVGDTVGPGGLLRGARAIPQYREIASTVRERCPDAWVINYSNPMTVCTRTLYEEFPDINAVGMCHEVFGTQEYLAGLVEEHLEEERPSREEIELSVKGINHFTWVDEARWRGRDLFPLVERELAEHEPLPTMDPDDLAGESYFINNHQITLDLFDRFGILPAAGDRHLAEFVPWYLDIDTPEEIQRWGIRLTPSEYRDGKWESDDEYISDLLAGDETLEFEASGEEAVSVMEAICGLGSMTTNVNIPNRGQCPDLPEGAVVETYALLSPNTVTPLQAGRLPRGVRNLVLTHVHNQETLIEAGFTGDLDLAFQAFLSDPLVSLDREAAADLFAELVEAEREFLQEWNLEETELL